MALKKIIISIVMIINLYTNTFVRENTGEITFSYTVYMLGKFSSSSDLTSAPKDSVRTLNIV